MTDNVVRQDDSARSAFTFISIENPDEGRSSANLKIVRSHVMKDVRQREKVWKSRPTRNALEKEQIDPDTSSVTSRAISRTAKTKGRPRKKDAPKLQSSRCAAASTETQTADDAGNQKNAALAIATRWSNKTERQRSTYTEDWTKSLLDCARLGFLEQFPCNTPPYAAAYIHHCKQFRPHSLKKEGRKQRGNGERENAAEFSYVPKTYYSICKPL
jgi:hypothetical protein